MKDTLAHLVRQRLNAAVTLCERADGQHFFHCALGYHLRFAALVLDNRGQAAAGKIKGDLVHLCVVFR